MVNRLLISVLLISSFAASAQKVWFDGLKKINGTHLYVKIVGEGEPLLIIHGGPGLNQSYFDPHLNTLAKKYKLIFYDQRASGRSATPATDSISLSFFINDIEALRQETGIEKIHLLAHSWGAIPVVAYGLAYPQRVKSVIFCNPVPLSKEFDKEMQVAQQNKVTSEDSTNRSIVIGSPDFKNGKANAYEKLMMLSFRHAFYAQHNFSKLQLELPADYVSASRALFTGLTPDLTQYDYYSRMKSFTFPVLILHGAADAVPLSSSTKLQGAIPGSSLQLFSKSGHFIFIDEPKRFTKEVSAFLH